MIKNRKDFDCRGNVVTRGARSPFLFGTPSPKSSSVPCVNHIGAGDAFAAHLVLSLAHGLPLEEAAAIAHSAGRVYVQHAHSRPPYPHEIRRDLHSCRGKVVLSTDLHALRRSIPGKLVFTNGIFRTGPHAGHAWLMQWAREQGDALVVGVNTDESARLVRPGEFVLPLDERIACLAAMEAVDWIIPFSEAEPTAIMEQLGADVLCKGREYAGCHVPGENLVKEVRFAQPGPFAERHASGLVAEIRGLTGDAE